MLEFSLVTTFSTIRVLTCQKHRGVIRPLARTLAGVERTQGVQIPNRASRVDDVLSIIG